VRKAAGEEGQAAVELALVLPFLALLFLGIVQVGLVVRDQVLLVHAAREAAREAAVEPSSSAPRRAALSGAPLDPARLEVRVAREAGAGRVAARLAYRSPTMVPIVGSALPDVALNAVASMRLEGPEGGGS
jgi:Flp pilus assembly protein TadG